MNFLIIFLLCVPFYTFADRTQTPACKKVIQKVHKTRKVSDKSRLIDFRMLAALRKARKANEEVEELYSEDSLDYSNEKTKIMKPISKSIFPYGDPLVAWGDERDKITREKHREARKKAGWADEPKIDQAFAMYSSNKSSAAHYRVLAAFNKKKAVEARKKLNLTNEPVKANFYRALVNYRQHSAKNLQGIADWEDAMAEKYKACGFIKKKNLPPWVRRYKRSSHNNSVQRRKIRKPNPAPSAG